MLEQRWFPLERGAGGQGFRGDTGVERWNATEHGLPVSSGDWSWGREDDLRPSGQRRRKTTDEYLRDGGTETEQVGERRVVVCQPVYCCHSL